MDNQSGRAQTPKQLPEDRSKSDTALSQLQLQAELASLPYADQIAFICPPAPVNLSPTPGGAGPKAPRTGVQASSSSSSGLAAGDTRAIASQGFKGTGSALPHLSSIQQSFGRHDVSGVQAHIGGPAGQAAQAIGASAYTTGDKVAFKSDPDLHTAAHEAAHVVQQRNGIELSGGVGRAGDRFERHADAVADRVVGGHSAEDLLSSVASGGSSSSLQAVQKDERESDRLQRIMEALEASPPDMDTALRDIGDLHRPEMRILRDDESRMTILARVVAGSGHDMVSVCLSLDCTLLQIVRYARAASQDGNLSGAEFVNRYLNAAVADLVEIADHEEELVTLMASGPLEGPHLTRRVQESRDNFLTLLSHDSALNWSLTTAPGADRLVESISGTLQRTLLRNPDVLARVLTHPRTAPAAVVRALSTLQLPPPQSVELLGSAGAAVMATPEYAEWFSTACAYEDLCTFLEGSGYTLLPNTIRPVALVCIGEAQPFATVLGSYDTFESWALAVGTWADLLQHIFDLQSPVLVSTLSEQARWNHIVACLVDERQNGGNRDLARDAINGLFFQSSDLETMMQLFTARYGILIGSQGDNAVENWIETDRRDERPFDVAGLQHVYYALLLVPPNQVEDNPSVITHITRHTEGSEGRASGLASRRHPCISLEYAQGRTEATSGEPMTEEGQALHGENVLDVTVLHEFAHRVDHGARYSGQQDFLDLAEWRIYRIPDDVSTLAVDLAYDITPAYNADIRPVEEQYAISGAAFGIVAQVTSWDELRECLGQIYDLEGQSRETPTEPDLRNLDDLFEILKDTLLYQHIGFAHMNHERWLEPPRRHTGGRQYHQSYAHEWASYSDEKRTNYPNASRYQWRNHREMFAECYAAWFLSDYPGQGLPVDFITWFRDQDLDTGPSST